jgi:hypothetical protein|nr:transposase [Aeromicrobium sp.]
MLVITAAHSRFMTARMIPTRKTGDLLSGSWDLIQRPLAGPGEQSDRANDEVLPGGRAGSGPDGDPFAAPIPLRLGWRNEIRLGRAYYVRLDTNGHRGSWVTLIFLHSTWSG